MVLFSKFDFSSEENSSTSQPEISPAESSQTLDEIELLIQNLENMWKTLMDIRSKIKAISMGISDLRENISQLISEES